jgi:hypothetical protein
MKLTNLPNTFSEEDLTIGLTNACQNFGAPLGVIKVFTNTGQAHPYAWVNFTDDQGGGGGSGAAAALSCASELNQSDLFGCGRGAVFCMAYGAHGSQQPQLQLQPQQQKPQKQQQQQWNQEEEEDEEEDGGDEEEEEEAAEEPSQPSFTGRGGGLLSRLGGKSSPAPAGAADGAGAAGGGAGLVMSLGGCVTTSTSSGVGGGGAPFNVGDAVSALYRDDGGWYPATVRVGSV